MNTEYNEIFPILIYIDGKYEVFIGEELKGTETIWIDEYDLIDIDAYKKPKSNNKPWYRHYERKQRKL